MNTQKCPPENWTALVTFVWRSTKRNCFADNLSANADLNYAINFNRVFLDNIIINFVEP